MASFSSLMHKHAQRFHQTISKVLNQGPKLKLRPRHNSLGSLQNLIGIAIMATHISNICLQFFTIARIAM